MSIKILNLFNVSLKRLELNESRKMVVKKQLFIINIYSMIIKFYIDCNNWRNKFT